MKNKKFINQKKSGKKISQPLKQIYLQKVKINKIWRIFGSLMAPKQAKTVAIVLMIVICCSELIAFYNENFVNGNYIRNIDIFAGIAGSIIRYIYVLEKNKIAQWVNLFITQWKIPTLILRYPEAKRLQFCANLVLDFLLAFKLGTLIL